VIRLIVRAMNSLSPVDELVISRAVKHQPMSRIPGLRTRGLRARRVRGERPQRRWGWRLPAGAATLAGAAVVIAVSSIGGYSHKAAAEHTRRAAKLDVRAPAAFSANWAVFASVGPRPAAWIARRNRVTLMRFDQQLVRLDLHAGWRDGGPTGWTYGDRIGTREINRIVAAFNGGFKLTHAGVGFESGGHVAVALKRGLASIVTYADGTTDVGMWRRGVPADGRPVFSVLQNQRLLVDHGRAAANVATCVLACWGGTVSLQTIVARSGLGVTAGGALVWAGGEHLSPGGLASALINAGAVRAIELDINPWWVAGYVYVHHAAGPVATQVVRGARGISGRLLTYPYSRDFIAMVAR